MPQSEDAAVYRTLSRALGIGVGLGLVPVIVGLVLALFAGGVARDVTFPGLGAVLAGVTHGDAVSFIFLGVVILLALPTVQAALAVAGFASRGNRRFALASAGVLAVQALALVVAWFK